MADERAILKTASGTAYFAPPKLAEGVKLDADKPDVSLLSSTWVFAVARVMTFGKIKYAAHNWRKGIAISRLMSASLRHIFAFIGGEDKDPETGESHLAHASCCLMFALETMEQRPQFDDRFKPEQKEAK